MQVKLYNNQSTKNKVNKNLQLVETLECQLYDNSSIMNPYLILKLSNKVLSCNYVYIPMFNRYYFINEAVVSDGNKVLLSCHVDVLESFKEEFLEQQVSIVRQEKSANYYLNDPLLQTLQKKNIQIKKLEQPEGNPFLTDPSINDTDYSYVFETM